jgi:hypothetical protein
MPHDLTRFGLTPASARAGPFCSTEGRAIDPHAMQDYSEFARNRQLGALHAAPFRNVQRPSLERGEAYDP